jgi:hypothetical protein
MTPEGLVKAHIKELLDYVGAYYFMPVQKGYGAKTVDFLVCFKGLFIAIEAKRPGKDATVLQKFIMENVRNAGGFAFKADNVFDVVQHLQTISLFALGGKAVGEFKLPTTLTEKWQRSIDRAAAKIRND